MNHPPPRTAIGMDIGGTSARCGLLSARGQLRRGSYHASPIDSKGSAESILNAFAALLRDCLQQATHEQLPLAGIGIGMCGPLDYEEGIVLMRGLDKYEALYGTNIKTALRERLGLAADFPILIEPDSWAFARGEAWLGAGRGIRRILALTLGTGLGSAFVADGRLLGDGPGVPPPFGWIGSLPFRGQLLDDFISRRGILSLYHSLAHRSAEDSPLQCGAGALAGGLSKPEPPLSSGSSIIDVRDIAIRARAGNRICLDVFEGFGHLLGSALAPVVREFGAECLILGGRSSQAFDLFEEALRCGLDAPPTLTQIAVTHSLTRSTLRGAAHLVLAPSFATHRQ